MNIQAVNIKDIDRNEFSVTKEGKLSIDGIELKNVTEYSLRSSAGKPAELTVALKVNVDQIGFVSRNCKDVQTVTHINNKGIGGESMAVVKDYYSPEGCHITVYDDCYKSPEEQEQIIKKVSELVLREEYRRFVESQQ